MTMPAGLTLVEDKTVPKGLTVTEVAPSVIDIDTAPIVTTSLLTEDPEDKSLPIAVLNATPVGRILDAFGQGARTGWGSDTIGLSAEVEKAGREAGIFSDGNGSWFEPLKAFNKALIMPFATALDLGSKTFGAAFYSLGAGLGQAAEESGLARAVGRSGASLTRDVVKLGETLGVLAGAAPIGLKPRAGGPTRPIAEPVPVETVVKVPEAPIVAAEVVPEPKSLATAEGIPPVAKAEGPSNLNMFGLSVEDANSIFNQIESQEKASLIRIFGSEEKALQYDRASSLYLKTSSESEAAKYKARMEELTRDLPEEKLAELNNIGFTDEARRVRNVYNETNFNSNTPIEDIVGHMTEGLGKLNKGDIQRVVEGRAELFQQAEVIRFARSMQELRERGMPEAEIRALAIKELRDRGFGADAEWFFENQMSLLQRREKPVAVEAPVEPKSIATAEGIPSSAKAEGLPAELVPDSPAVDKAGNINLSRIGANEDVKDVIRAAAEKLDPTERRPTTLAEIQETAQAMGISTEQWLEKLKNRSEGQIFNAADATAIRQAFTDETARIQQLGVKIAKGEATELEMLDFIDATKNYPKLTEQLMGETAQLGRALSARRIVAGSMDQATAIAQIINENGGADGIKKIANKLAGLPTAAQRAKFLQDMEKASFMDKIVEYWSNALRSGFSTPAANFMANTVTSIGDISETALTAVIGKMLKSEQRITAAELQRRLVGLVQGAKEGQAMGWEILKTETVPQLGTAQDLIKKAIPGKAGEVVRLPTRLDMASDAFFRSTIYRSEVNGLAWRQAGAEGFTGAARVSRAAQLVSDVPDNIFVEAYEHARKVNLGKPLGPLGSAVVRAMEADPTKILRFISPFVRVPTNILKFAGERTPGLNLLSKEVRANLKGENGAVARDREIAKMFVGSSIGLTTILMAVDDQITGGGPVDPAERALWLRDHQPYSMRIGDTWYSYRRWTEPYGLVMGMAADLAAAAPKLTNEEYKEGVVALLMAIKRNVIEASALRGPADVVKVLNEPERYGPNFANNFIASLLVPGVVSQFRKEDDYVREARSVVDALRNKVPGLGAVGVPELPARIDVFGEPIRRPEAFGTAIVNPIMEMNAVNDPIVNELRSLEIFPGRPDRKIRGVELTPEQYEDYATRSGKLVRINLAMLMQSPGYSSMPEFARREVVEKVIHRSREVGRAYMQVKYPQLIRDAATLRMIEVTTGKKPK